MNRIPLELRSRSQWCYTDGKTKAPRGQNGRLVSVTAPSDWLSYEQAVQLAQKCGGGIGYVLSEDDPFTCIDLDIKDASNEANQDRWTSQENVNRMWEICQRMESYTEFSQGGRGLHIWVRGKIGRGGRRDGVEVYSQERFIICTGKGLGGYANKNIENRQELLDLMIREIRRAAEAGEKVILQEIDEELTDQEIFDRAMGASNSSKFEALCLATSCQGTGDKKIHGSYAELTNGDGERLYPSQSEADLALISIFAFYTKSNEQCRRLFKYSNLGKRDKATKDNRYLDETLRIIRKRQGITECIDTSALAASASLVAEIAKQKKLEERSLMHVPTGIEPKATLPPASVAVATMQPPRDVPGVNELPWPPGLAGQIASFVYHSSMRPVKEVAIVTALGFLAGVCGKAWHFAGSGLNLYIILVARSAIGKEAMNTGMSSLLHAVTSRQPPANTFISFDEYVSGPALRKTCLSRQSFVNVAGEFGRRLKRFSTDEGDSPASQLRTVLTDLYQKSAPMSVVGGQTYSNQESNLTAVNGVAFSMIGESTPNTFYESLTQSMIEDGFLSRFSVIECRSQRPPLNPNPITEPSKVLGDALADLCTHSLTLAGRHESCLVKRTEEAANMYSAFELEGDAQINATEDEIWRQMWNRASIKAMKIGSLLAVADNWINPIVEKKHVEWALDLVRRDIAIFTNRIEAGDIGDGDDARERKVNQVIQDYFAAPPSNYINESMRKDGVIDMMYLQLRLARMSIFCKFRGGSSAALASTLKSLCEQGILNEMPKEKIITNYAKFGRAFRVLNLTRRPQNA